MKIIYSDSHRAHNPPFEVFEGGRHVPYLENADRMDCILNALRETDWADIVEPVDFGLGPIHAIHDRGYLAFLATCWTDWLEINPELAASPDKITFLPATFALRRQPHIPRSLLGKAGYYMMDLSACVVESTHQTALISANCALSAAQLIEEGSKAAFALNRPPGHHAGKDYAGGYCYINNAAVAANYLARRGKVAILDIDYHAGNGTQDIFYSRKDVLTISLHGDPEFEYPYFVGYADETGEGSGMGYHRNFPLPKDTEDDLYLLTLENALELIRKFSPAYLVLSAGMDTYGGDPLGKFHLTRDGIREIGDRIASLRIPTAVVLEGGYANSELGANTCALLENFA